MKGANRLVKVQASEDSGAVTIQTAEFDGRGRRIKKVVESSLDGLPRVPAYRHLFERIERKNNKPTAIVAVARRMLEDAFTMLKRNQAFRFLAVSTTDASQPVGTVVRLASWPKGHFERRRLKFRWRESGSPPTTTPCPYVSRRSNAT